MTPRLILASASPRRRVLLEGLGVSFAVWPADIDETPRPGEQAEELVARLARTKAEAVLAAGPEGAPVVLAADTVVAVDGQVLGKPVDEADAARMLRLLSGSTHAVLTGVAVASERSVAVAVETTTVVMGRWSDVDIDAYVASGEPMDKAGAYAIQEVGDRFVDAIRGGFDNVVGLPVARAARMLRAAGVEVAQPPEV